MLLRTLHKRLSLILIGMFLLGSPTLGLAGGARRSKGANTTGAANPDRQSIGAPQVLEIPPVQETSAPPVESAPASTFPTPPERSAEITSYSDRASRSLGAQERGDERGREGTVQSPASPERRNYLGV